MLANLLRVLMKDGYAVKFEQSGKTATKVTVHLDTEDGMLVEQAISEKPLWALMDALECMGRAKGKLTEAALDLAGVGPEGRTEAQKEQARINGKKGGRPRGVKDSKPRSRRTITQQVG